MSTQPRHRRTIRKGKFNLKMGFCFPNINTVQLTVTLEQSDIILSNKY